MKKTLYPMLPQVNMKFDLQQTNHSLKRAAQRGVTIFKIDATIDFGECFRKQGLLFYVLGEKNIPKHLLKELDKLKNTVVVVAGDTNKIITYYRSRNPFKHIKMKSKFLSPNYLTAV